MDPLQKIYVEPTNRCNLKCVTCIRNAWNEPSGDMDWSVLLTRKGCERR